MLLFLLVAAKRQVGRFPVGPARSCRMSATRSDGQRAIRTYKLMHAVTVNIVTHAIGRLIEYSQSTSPTRKRNAET